MRVVELGLGLLLVACGGEDLKASEHCEDLVDVLCENIENECVPSVSAEECVELAVDAGLDCDHAVGLDDDYDSCFEKLSDADGCLVDDDLPDDCVGVILLAE